MISRFSSLFISIFFIITISGCASGHRIIAGPAAPDIVNYVNQGLISIAELERRSLESYASVTGKNYTTDHKVYETLKNFVIPTYKRFVDGLIKIAPQNPKIRQVNDIYVNAAELMLQGFKMKMIGIKNNDDAIIVQGNKKIEEARAGIKKWRAELKELYKENGVTTLKNK